MATQIKLRRATAEQWTTANPILAAGEAGFELDTNQLKIGNGTNTWNSLEYVSAEVDLTPYLTIASASTTYATKQELEAFDLSNYLTISSASSTYSKSIVDISNKTSTSNTLSLSDKDMLVKVTSSATNTVIVPSSASVNFPIGTQISITQFGDGMTQISPASGVTVRTPSGLSLRSKYSSATIIKVGTDEWLAAGDLVV